jgi:pimeloyl-ACP methyl ester carboxylesterase
VRRDTAKFLRGVDRAELVEVSIRLQRFTKPVLVLWGDADRFFTIDLAYRLLETFPDTRLVEIPGGRTFFPLDEPQRVADEIQSAFQPRR